ncbi:MAG: hypothetical protein L7T26_09255 [Pseudomonadales bacterium]|jgi:hypothetical protein|nr:hypothetical protein [Pseudomonadales bacterium]
MTQAMSFLIQALPMPCFVLDDDGALACFNQAARVEFEDPEQVLAHCLEHCSEFPDEVGNFESEFQGIPMTGTYLKEGDRCLVFLESHQELHRLQNEVQKLKKPQKHLIQALQNLVATTKGYSELIAVMLEENQLVAGERLAAVRRYEQYVNDHLVDMEGLLEEATQGKPFSATPFESSDHPIALVCLSNAVRSELVAELFMAQGMAAETSESLVDVSDRLLRQPEDVRLLVIDQPIEALGAWLRHHPEASVILLGDHSEASDLGDRSCLLTDSPMDINQLLKAAINLLNS